MGNSKLTESQLAKFRADGFLMVEELFDREEMNLLQSIPYAGMVGMSEAPNWQAACTYIGYRRARN